MGVPPDSEDSEDREARASACAYEAEAWVDGELVARSAAARELHGADGVRLCFPAADVRARVAAPLQTTPLDGFVAYDHTDPRVVVLLVDPMGTPASERDRTTKRYPVWGDAADLIAMLDVQPYGPGRFVSATRGGGHDHHRGVVEGSQMLGQALVAAGRHAPGRRAVSASMVFMRAAGTHEPLTFELEQMSGGRNFTTMGVRVCQADKLCASGLMLLDVTAPDVMRHAAPAPEVAGPYACEPYDMSVTGRDVRFVDNAYTGDPDAPPGPPVLDAWVRFREVPADRYLHAGLLAHFTGHASIAAAMRPHAGIGQRQAHRTLSTAINAIHLSLHADVSADAWMHYRHRSTFAGDGMTHSECSVRDIEGRLLASFSVDAMVRRMSAPPSKAARSTL